MAKLMMALIAHVMQWCVAPHKIAIRQQAARMPQMIDQVFMMLSCSYDCDLVSHLCGVRDAEFSAHSLGEFACALPDVSDI